jgi:hypothetical protein
MGTSIHPDILQNRRDAVVVAISEAIPKDVGLSQFRDGQTEPVRADKIGFEGLVTIT